MVAAIDNNIAECILRAKQYEGVSRIGVFGSFARAEQTDDSDIDILYDYHYVDCDNNGIDSTFEFLDVLESDLSKLLGNRNIDFTSYQGLLDSKNNNLKESVLSDVIWVFDRNTQPMYLEQ